MTFSCKKQRFVFVLPICLYQYNENVPENKTLLNEDLRGDFENKAGKKYSCKQQKTTTW